MTGKETVEILQELWRYKETDKYTESEIRLALDIAIQTLKNQPRFILQSCGRIEKIEPWGNVLDEITDELKSVKEKWWYGVDNDCFIKLSDVLQVIDKYKTESEAAE